MLNIVRIHGGEKPCVLIMGYWGVLTPCSRESFKLGFERTNSKGPDDTRIIDTGRGLLGFPPAGNYGATSGGNAAFSS